MSKIPCLLLLLFPVISFLGFVKVSSPLKSAKLRLAAILAIGSGTFGYLGLRMMFVIGLPDTWREILPVILDNKFLVFFYSSNLLPTIYYAFFVCLGYYFYRDLFNNRSDK